MMNSLRELISMLKSLLHKILPSQRLIDEEPKLGHKPRTTREDVLRMIESNGGPEGLDLSGYDLSGINLSRLDLHGVIFGSTELLILSDSEDILLRGSILDEAWLERSNLQRANFGRASAKGTHFYHADLTEATFWAANVEGADFRKANLTRVDLYSTVLNNCRLADARLTGVNFDRASLIGATLSAESIGASILQEEHEEYKQYFARWYVSPHVRDEYMEDHLTHSDKKAMEIYLALKNVFLNAGRYDDASWAYIKERQMERKTFHPIAARKYYGKELPDNCTARSLRWWRFNLKYAYKWLVTWLAELLVGYGERPLRVLFWAFVTILSFATIYWLSGGIANTSGGAVYWFDCFQYSLAAFSTMGFPDLVSVNDLTKLLTSLEALSGISVLALLMFSLGNRINRS